MTSFDAERIKKLLNELNTLLEKEGEKNWLRGVRLALAHMSYDEHLKARSIYSTMCKGGRGFMEYYIQDSQKDLILSSCRDELWDLFRL